MNNLSLFNELEQLLRNESEYCSEDGILLKNAIVEAALALRPSLIKLLLSHDGLKRNFFTEIEGVLVFDKVKFQKFVMNKRFLPDSYTSFKNKIGLTTEDGDFISDSREVVLSWPYKDCVLEGGQTKEDAKRNEVFWNEILAPDEINRLTEPKALCNFTFFNNRGGGNVTSLSYNDNFIIKGNNLLALYTLLPKYKGTVKLIYIDPPFNTGNDGFKYNDTFNESTWLTFMQNRLKIAYSLLKNNGGLLCVHCDDNQGASLKILLDEVYGTSNFVTTVVVKSSTPSGLKTTHKTSTIIKTKDYIHIYKKGEITINPQYIAKSNWDSHFSYYLDKENHVVRSLIDVLVENEIIPEGSKLADLSISNPQFRQFYQKHKKNIFQTQPVMPEVHKKASLENPDEIYQYESNGEINYARNGRRFSFLSESMATLENGNTDLGLLLCDFWHDIDFQNTQNEGGVSFPGGKKPEKLLRRLIYLFTDVNDLILDFNLGSGTTAAVAMKLRRKFIGIDQMDYIKTIAIERLKNVINGDKSGISEEVHWKGGGSFVYCELAAANQTFVDEINAAENTDALKRIWERMQQTGFLSWKVEPKHFDENAKAFEDLSLGDQKRFLVECLDKNLLYIPLSEIDNDEYGLKEKDKELTRKFYAM
ncbi:MAG: site-specific DNA-methyltransferase [Bacteroidales bacterium]|nr:site-specific DNA-methyltransferase [Bacteroidales bacterium]